MLRQAKNEVFITGILSEIDLKYGNYNGTENINGSIKVRVETADGINEIPVHFYSNKLTKEGKVNPSYESIEKVKNTFVSIASCGNENEASKVSLVGQIDMNEYYSQNQTDRLIRFPRIRASFVKLVSAEKYEPEAKFNVEFAIAKIAPIMNAEGEDTGVLQIEGIIPGYQGRVTVAPFKVVSPKAKAFVEENWHQNDTVPASGRLSFTSKTEVIKVERDFGEPEERKRTISTSDLIITAGNYAYDEAQAFNMQELATGMNDRKVRLEQAKEKANAVRVAPSATSSVFGDDLGF